MKTIVVGMALTGGFLIAEVIGAFPTNSLALLSDAAHMDMVPRRSSSCYLPFDSIALARGQAHLLLRTHGSDG